MYDQIGQAAWKFDRCVEAESLTPLILLVIVMASFILVYKLARRARLKTLLALIVGTLSSIVLIPFILFAILIFGFVVVGCSAGPLWQPARAAHEIHAKIKELRAHNLPTPADEKSLSILLPYEYSNVTATAKTKYIFDEHSDRYYWLIRPSRYFVFVFDNQKDYQLYRINNLLLPRLFSTALPAYPPPHQGPWDELPR